MYLHVYNYCYKNETINKSSFFHLYLRNVAKPKNHVISNPTDSFFIPIKQEAVFIFIFKFWNFENLNFFFFFFLQWSYIVDAVCVYLLWEKKTPYSSTHIYPNLTFVFRCRFAAVAWSHVDNNDGSIFSHVDQIRGHICFDCIIQEKRGYYIYILYPLYIVIRIS